MLEINKLELKAKFNDTFIVLNRDRENIVNTSSWKPLFRKTNSMMYHYNEPAKLVLQD